jgi:hypothetical protein
MDKNRIGGIRRRASWQLTTKPISIKGAGCKSGGGALKAVELTSGDLLLVAESRLRKERSNLSRQQKSAEGIVSRLVGRRPERSSARRLRRAASRQRNS